MALTREQNRAKQQRYRANKKARELAAAASVSTQTAAVAGTVEPSLIAAVVDEPTLKVTVKADAPAPKQKPTLRERLGLGGAANQAVPTPAKRKPATGKSNKPNLVVTLLPTIIASLVATYARDRLPEEYQACAPSKNEVQAIIGPLMEIIGRRVEFAAQVSQDAIDLTNSLICMIAYGARAYITYVDIKKAGTSNEQHKQQPARAARIEQEARDYAEIESDPEQTLARGLRAYQAQTNGTGVAPVGVNGGRPYESGYGTNSNGASDPADDRELRDREAALVANLFARDKQGRVGLGLLPRTV